MARKGIDETISAVRDCVCAALEAAEVEMCICSSTVGTPVIAPVCECNELWANLIRIFRADRNTLSDTVAVKPCAPATWAAQVRITFARCFPTLTDMGELPSPEALDAAASVAHADAATMIRAAHCCTDTEPVYVEGVDVSNDPSGGRSYITMTIRVPVDITKSANAYPTP